MLNEKLYRRVVNWEDVPGEEVRPGIVRRVYATDDVMMTMNVVARGMELKPHAHSDFDQLVYITEGRCWYHVDGVAHEMGPGSMMLVPAGADHFIEPISQSCVNVDVFVPPRSDYADAHRWIETLGDGGS